MPYYGRLADLPEGVRNNLPQHAQKIYRAAFNNAWEQYDRDEERAHRVAWAAVKEKYEKSEKTGKWKKRRAAARPDKLRPSIERVPR